MQNILVVVSHPDDELLGVGGTLGRHVLKGDRIFPIIVAEGATSRKEENNGEVSKLQTCAIKAAAILGTEKPMFLNFPDNQLDSIPLLEIIKLLEEKTTGLEITTVYTHHGSDLNIDHRIVHQAVITTFRPIPDSCIKNILAFETLSSTEWSSNSVGPIFTPNMFVDITETINTKIEALKVYDTELRKFPHPRSINAIEALAAMRGSSIGVPAAEAFEVILTIV